jgi:hypothetical protein
MAWKENIQQLVPNVGSIHRFPGQLIGPYVLPPFLSAWRVTVKHSLVDVLSTKSRVILQELQ